MNYISTRGGDESLSLAQILTRGTARNGGLFVPRHWPTVTPDTLDQLLVGEYADIGGRLLSLFGAESLPQINPTEAIHSAMERFDKPVGPPVVQLRDDLWNVELMNGPTLAFKDFALAPLAEIIDLTLQRSDRQATVLCATSGDTGAATVSAFANRSRLRAVVLFPKGGVSDFQRRQMTTTGAENVLPLCIDGDFDDCQRIVKALYQTPAAEKHGYTAVNSINMLRILLQTAYYFRSSGIVQRQSGKPCNFIVPTGNFGNVYAAYIAKQLGAPINKLIVTSNDNDVLPRLFESSRMQGKTTVKTISPSMDIQVSSNFERMLWHIKNNDGAAVNAAQQRLDTSAGYELTDTEMDSLNTLFIAFKCTHDDAVSAIRNTWQAHHKIICPHTATAAYAAEKLGKNIEGGNVIVETAHPIKFSDAVFDAIGVRSPVPDSAKALMINNESFESAEATAEAVQAVIESKFG